MGAAAHARFGAHVEQLVGNISARLASTSAKLDFPLPRAIANENNPPRVTASSILAMTFRWSGDQSRWKVCGK